MAIYSSRLGLRARLIDKKALVHIWTARIAPFAELSEILDGPPSLTYILIPQPCD